MMTTFSSLLNSMTNELTISMQQIEQIAAAFQQAMEEGLSGKSSSLKLLPSYLEKSSGQETGTYLALDFGGSNVRVFLIDLMGSGQYLIRSHSKHPLQQFITVGDCAEALFDAIAGAIAKLASNGPVCYLGHTFSFPSRQWSINNAALLHWTKEINTSGVIGRNVNQLLQEALLRCGVRNVLPKAIVNDTVGTLLAGSYYDQRTDIGTICGTGHNTAYLEPRSPATAKPMILNLESGNFNQLPRTAYDRILDKTSDNPGSQILEKMVSGRYIGELFRFMAMDLIPSVLENAKPASKLSTPYAITGEDITLFLSDHTQELDFISNWLSSNMNLMASSLSQRAALRQIATRLVSRSARLIAATYIGILRHIDPTGSSAHSIAIDGSLYEKVPGYAASIRNALIQCHEFSANRIALNLIKDGSGVGAAIAAAIAVKAECCAERKGTLPFE